ncbi:hypothetical protein [Streptosporangium sp. NPDC051022]|uniref:hypothetical protein n=1 Tax=Streptosporangium sp. NPDC051022 TaxID=3155752 RepID=UPI00343D818F
MSSARDIDHLPCALHVEAGASTLAPTNTLATALDVRPATRLLAALGILDAHPTA